MKKLLILSAIGLLVISCSAKEDKVLSRAVIIAGQVIHTDEHSTRVVAVHFMDPFNQTSTRAQLIDPQDGSFRIVYEMPYGQSVNVLYDNYYMNLYLEPGDSIHMQLDAEQFRKKNYGEMLTYTGDKGELNAQFTPGARLFTEQINADYQFASKASTVDEFLEVVRLRLEKSRDSLQVYAQENNISEQVKSLIDNEILAIVIYYAPFSSQMRKPEAAERIFSAEFFDPFDTSKSSSSMFPYSLYSYFSLCVDLPDFPAEGSQAELIEYFKACEKELSRMPKGLSRDILITHQFESASNYISDILQKFPDLEVLFDSPYAWSQYQKSVKKEVPQFETCVLPDVSLITADQVKTPLADRDIFEYLAEQFPGQVIYIDICASWCGPCIWEIPHHKQLHEELKEEDVVFVSFWMSSGYEDCAALIRENQIAGEHFYFSGDAGLLFRGTYGYKGFPTYMLVNRSGKIADLDAGRPSAPKTRNQIQHLLDS